MHADPVERPGPSVYLSRLFVHSIIQKQMIPKCSDFV